MRESLNHALDALFFLVEVLTLVEFTLAFIETLNCLSLQSRIVLLNH